MFIFMSFSKVGKISATNSSSILSAPFSLSSVFEASAMYVLVSLTCLVGPLRSVHFHSVFFPHFLDSVLSIALASSSLILLSACANLPLNHPGEFFISVILFNCSVAFCFHFRSSVSLLIFPFSVYIICLIFSMSFFSFLIRFQQLF